LVRRSEQPSTRGSLRWRGFLRVSGGEAQAARAKRRMEPSRGAQNFGFPVDASRATQYSKVRACRLRALVLRNTPMPRSVAHPGQILCPTPPASVCALLHGVRPLAPLAVGMGVGLGGQVGVEDGRCCLPPGGFQVTPPPRTYTDLPGVPAPEPSASHGPPRRTAQGVDYTVIPRINTLQCDVYGDKGRKIYSVSTLPYSWVGLKRPHGNQVIVSEPSRANTRTHLLTVILTT
jgi:hypothetical protein